MGGESFWQERLCPNDILYQHREYPDNNYLVFTSDGTLVGQLSSSFVSSLRNGDVFLLGGSTYRVSSVIGTRVNVTPATGYRPTIPSWTGEANSRSSELSNEVLELLDILSVQYRTGNGITPFLIDVLGLNKVWQTH